jgi:hypothetical protein
MIQENTSLKLDNALALRLMQKAEGFYLNLLPKQIPGYINLHSKLMLDY